MFHVELKQGLHVGRSFNLGREQLDAEILVPWVSERTVALQERWWSPATARLTILEGPALAPQDIGLGRGWSNAQRHSQDVTAQLLDAARAGLTPTIEKVIEAFKAEVTAWGGGGGVELAELLAAANDRFPGWRVSERLALVERAVWELLHAGQVRLVSQAEPVEPQGWAPVILSWENWVRPGVSVVAPA